METRTQVKERVRKEMIELLAQTVKDAFESASANDLEWGKDQKIFPTELTNQIKSEIINALSQSGYTDAMSDIICQLHVESQKNKKLPDACRELVGELVISKDQESYLRKNIKGTGWCKLFLDAMKFDYLIGYSLGNPSKTRARTLFYDFAVMIAKCADPAYLSQLKMESTLLDVPTVKVLRKSHGLFFRKKEDNSKRYKSYTAWLDILIENQSIQEEPRAVSVKK